MSHTLTLCALLIPVGCAQAQQQPATLTFDAPQTAGISGLRPMWNEPVVTNADGAQTEADKEQFGKAISALKTSWDAEKKLLDVSYQTGKDVLHCVYNPQYAGGAPTSNGFAVREVNGQWPYNAPGLERDSSLTQQGTTGKLEKNGAVLTSEPGKMTYLLTEPKSGTFMGLNPFFEPTFWEMSVLGETQIKADG